MLRILPILFLFFVTACAEIVTAPEDAPLVLKPVSYAALPGWGGDNLLEAIPALERSCERIQKGNPVRDFGPPGETGTYAHWQTVCQALSPLDKNDNAAAQAFFERYFQPYEASAGGVKDGLFTGYYEASLKGSATRHAPYLTPLYARPDDLVMVNLGEFRDELKGQRIAGRVQEGQLKPYEDRAAIVSGNWPHVDKVLVWVDSPVDAFYVQIQGSGVVQMEDGSVMRIGYAGQNGHIYYAIGRELVKRGHLLQDNVSMQAIRDWLEANPVEAEEVMNTNRSYVFFKQLEGTGPEGGEGVVLTPERSMAIDHSKMAYGIPLWVDIPSPNQGIDPLQRMLIAQDTGGAIRGAVRGDVFWGYGARAESLAGPMKSTGRYWLLLPRVDIARESL
jgi:membrane-bound lytic murein transglycosylase A